MTKAVEGSSTDDPLASLQLDVAAGGGPSTEIQQSESQAEVSTLFISTNDDDINGIIAGVWHGRECTSNSL